MCGIIGYVGPRNVTPLLIEGLDAGGQLMLTTTVENFPGFATAVQGPWLMDQMAAQAAHVGTTLVEDMIGAWCRFAKSRMRRVSATGPPMGLSQNVGSPFASPGAHSSK